MCNVIGMWYVENASDLCSSVLAGGGTVCGNCGWGDNGASV